MTILYKESKCKKNLLFTCGWSFYKESKSNFFLLRIQIEYKKNGGGGGGGGGGVGGGNVGWSN